MKELRCTRCGSSDLRRSDDVIICNSCDAVFVPEDKELDALSEAGEYRDGIDPVARNILDLLEHKTHDPKEALRLANVAVDAAPESAEAHWCRMQVLTSHLLYVDESDVDAHALVEEGEAVLRYAQRLTSNEYEDHRLSVYKEMLSAATSEMSLSAEIMEDQKSLDDEERRCRDLGHYSGKSLKQALEEDDRFWVGSYAGAYPSAKILAHAVPDEALEDYPELKSLLEEYIILLRRDTDARHRRFARYGQDLTKEEKEDREEEMAFQKTRL